MGWVAGIGRWGAVFGPWLGGQLVAAGATKWGFGAYALDGLLGALLMSLALLTVRASRGGTTSDTARPAAAVS